MKTMPYNNAPFDHRDVQWVQMRPMAPGAPYGLWKPQDDDGEMQRRIARRLPPFDADTWKWEMDYYDMTDPEDRAAYVTLVLLTEFE